RLFSKNEAARVNAWNAQSPVNTGPKNQKFSKDSPTAAATLWPRRKMKTGCERGILLNAAGNQSRYQSEHQARLGIWPDAYWHNAMSPFAARRESPRRNVCFLCRVHARRRKERMQILYSRCCGIDVH